MKKQNLKIQIAILLLFMFLGSYAQSSRFYYNLSMKMDSTYTLKDLMVLETSNDRNIFFSNEYLRVDSINNSTNKFRFPYPDFKNIITWKKNDHSFEFKKNVSMYFYQYNKKVTIDWQLMDETKKIGVYTVQKALGEYGGRKWTAWFTNEIPLPYGPYVFYGLPGIVLEVYDSEKNHHFSFVQNKNFDYALQSEKILEKYNTKKVSIKESDWKQIQLNFYNNPIPEYKNGNAMMLKDNGTQYSTNDYRDLEISIKNDMKRYNNPIELSEKIEYP